MNFIDKIVKLWYQTPKFYFNFTKNNNSIQLKLGFNKRDSRSFEWYMDRKTIGFDERELWNLSYYLFEKFYLLYPELKLDDSYISSSISYEDDKEIQFNNQKKIYRTILKNREKFDTILQWFYIRMKQYIEWECPLSIYIGKDCRKSYLKNFYFSDEYMKTEDKKIYSKKCLSILKKIIDKEEITYDEKKQFFHILDEFGW